MNEAKATLEGARGKALRAFLALLLALSGVLGALSPALAGKAHAIGEEVDKKNSINIHTYDISGGYDAVNGGCGYKTEDGDISYCYDATVHGPGTEGHEYTHLRRGTHATDYLYACGYPSTRTIGGTTWSAGKAQAITQLAAWLLSDTDYSGQASFVNASDDVVKAAQKLEGEARAYEGGDPDIDGCSCIAYVDGKKEIQPMLTGNLFGHISLTKVSSNPSLTDGNDCYDLSKVKYGIYTDKACTEDYRGYVLTMDEAHNADLDLVPGTYYVKEKTSGTNTYTTDKTVYKVIVKSRETTAVNGGKVKDTPVSDPVPMLVMKVDAATGKSAPEGSGTLAGAEFTVKFYAGHYATADAAESSGKLKKTWVFRTDADGFADYADSYKVSGPGLYHMSNGDPTLPLGTVVIQETKAPAGYRLDDGSGGAPKKFCIQITADGAVGEAVYTYNAPKSPDTIKRGDYRLVKEVPLELESESGITQESKRILLPGVQFQIVNSSSNAIVSPQTGAEVQPGGVVCTITTDENGFASTRGGASVNGWNIPSGWTGALAYGTYTVHEVIPASVAASFKAKYGQTLFPVPDWRIAIAEERQYDGAVLVNNHIPQTPLKVVKYDSETGQQIPVQCSFKLLDSRGRPVTYEYHSPETYTVDTWSTNEMGELMLPMLLEEGDYTLVEADAPGGYVRALEGKTVHIDAVYNTWESPITVRFPNTPQKGKIHLAKTDSGDGSPVEGCVYVVEAAADVTTPDGTLRASKGETVATLVTDEAGRAASGELYLGTYTVYEAKAKDGYALDTAEKTVTLEYQCQDVAVFDEDLEVSDTPTELRLRKVDAIDPGKPVERAKFRIWNDSEEFFEELTTGPDGLIDVSHMRHGAYHVQEVEAPEGYVINDVDEEGNPKVHDLVVNDQGMFETEGGGMTAVLDLVIENMPKTMRTTATDAASGAHEGQARGELVIRDVVKYTGTIPGKEYKVKGILMDKKEEKAALDADGKEITAETTFKADSFEGTVEVVFAFNGVNLAGRSLVAFETMEQEGVEYIVHADIEDADQTVNIVDIGTQAKNPETDDQTGIAADELELSDTVGYTGLTPGVKYTMTGHIVDSITGDLLLDSSRIAYTCVKEFEPKEADGELSMEFKIDASELAGKTTVFTEALSDADGHVIAVHEDPSDEGQSIFFPAIRTKAVDGADGDKNVIAADKVKVVDTVTYENLIPNKEFTLTGILMDKSTKKPLKDAKGKEVTSSATFKPKKPSGEEKVEFAFDATGLEGKTAVVFETLVKDGIEVAAHADIEDEDQAVNIVEEPVGKGYPKTGAMATATAAGAGVLALLAYGLSGGGSALLKRRKKGNIEEALDEQ